MSAYCFKCKTKREIEDPKTIAMKNKRSAIQGVWIFRQFDQRDACLHTRFDFTGCTVIHHEPYPTSKSSPL
jgi:hypothetical protein